MCHCTIYCTACFCTAAMRGLIALFSNMSEQWKPSLSKRGWRSVELRGASAAATVASRQGSPNQCAR